MRLKKRRTPTGRPGRRVPGAADSSHLYRVRAKAVSQRSSSGIIPLVDCHGFTEVGKRRKENEDAFLLTALPTGRELRPAEDPAGNRLVPSPGQTGFLLLVADGIGGAPCGERASSMAVKSLCGYLKKESRLLNAGRMEILRALRQGVHRCQSDLRAEVERRPECEGMSSTLTGILSMARRFYIVHSGDSRCYLLRGSTLTLLTDDHSQAQLEIDAGTMDREAARKAPGGNSLWNFLASDYTRLDPDLGSMPLEPGDLFLLCTDGISDALAIEEIQQHLSIRASAESICNSLIDKARKDGGGDDLTAIVARFGASA